MNKDMVKGLDDGPAPEPAVEWMLYQALAGVLPMDIHPEDADRLKALEERFIAYVEKALREAKLRTNWGDSNEAYEQAVIAYARHLISPDNQAFVADFSDTIRPFARAGLVNGVTQTIIKLTAPGVPDIYQGSEGLDFSLVDPDNRRTPDFGLLQKRLMETEKLDSDLEEDWQTGRLKQHVITTLLRLRQETPTLFRSGEYLPLSASGKRADNVLAYARTGDEDAFIVLTPRLVFNALHMDLSSPRNERWAETEVSLPPRLANRRYRDVFTGKIIDPQERIAISWVFAEHPFALLLAN
jgi:(1->4)-alpha-D-glucan 1-alpha-D-glucosylmutase